MLQSPKFKSNFSYILLIVLLVVLCELAQCMAVHRKDAARDDTYDGFGEGSVKADGNYQPGSAQKDRQDGEDQRESVEEMFRVRPGELRRNQANQDQDQEDVEEDHEVLNEDDLKGQQQQEYEKDKREDLWSVEFGEYGEEQRGKRRVKRREFDDDDYEGAGDGESVAEIENFVSKASKEEKNDRRGPKLWDHWGKWSECSVTCGIGKITRWRHCVGGGCATGEKEAQIKTCTYPAC